MKKLSRVQKASQQGAAVVEYALLLALLAIVCILVLTTLGSNSGPENSSDIAGKPDGLSAPSAADRRVGATLDCPEDYRIKAKEALRLAETTQELGQSDRQSLLAQTYLAFAQAAETHSPQNCPSKISG